MSPVSGGAVSPNHRQTGMDDLLPSNVVDPGQNVEQPTPPLIPIARDPTVVEHRPSTSSDTSVLSAVGVGLGVLAVGGGVLAYKASSLARSTAGHVRLPTSHVSDSSRGDSVPRSYVDDRFEIGSMESDSVNEPTQLDEPVRDRVSYRQWGDLRRRRGLGFVGAGLTPGLIESDSTPVILGEFSDVGSQTDFTPSLDASVQAVPLVVDATTSATLNYELAEIDSGLIKFRGWGLTEIEDYVTELLDEISEYRAIYTASEEVILLLSEEKRNLLSQVRSLSHDVTVLNSQVSDFIPTRLALDDLRSSHARLIEDFTDLQDRYSVAEQHIVLRNNAITSLEAQLRRRPPRSTFR